LEEINQMKDKTRAFVRPDAAEKEDDGLVWFTLLGG